MSRRPLRELDAIPKEYQQLFTDDYLGDRHVPRAWAQDPAVVEATPEYLSELDDQLGQRREERTIPTVALGLLVDFYLWLCDCIVSVAPPFGGGEFVGWAPDEETVSEHSESTETTKDTDRTDDGLVPSNQCQRCGLSVRLDGFTSSRRGCT